MKEIKKIQHRTADGSPTLYMKEFDEYYHSKHGAIQEALHVYLKMGFTHWQLQNSKRLECRVFEMGFGTGLNAFLTAEAASNAKIKVLFDSIEAYPLAIEEIKEVGYSAFFEGGQKRLFDKIIDCPWETETPISNHFHLIKQHISLEAYAFKSSYDLIYYDAFGARTQPELWEDDCFPPIVENLSPGGVFVTYSAKGSVRRVLERLGMTVSLVQGPPGKREMIQAVRPLL